MYSINTNPQIKPPKTQISGIAVDETPLFCFCSIAQDKETEKILDDKGNCKRFVKSIFKISKLKTIGNIRKDNGLDFEKLQDSRYSVRLSQEYRIIFDCNSIHFILKTIKHKNKYKKNYIQ
jgi:plasmid maintenance system killer protein